MALAIDSEPPPELVERIRGEGFDDAQFITRLARGGGWVVAQYVLMVLVVVLGFLPPFWPDVSSASSGSRSRSPARSASSGRRGARQVDDAVSAPRETGELIEKGPYGFVRHPIYVAGLLFFLGSGCSSSVPATLGALALGTLWWLEGRRRGAASRGAVPRVRRLPSPRPALDLGGCGGAGTLQIVRATWPEPVERVAAYLREAGAEARLEELESGTATAEDAARPPAARSSQIVKSIVLMCDGKPVVALVPGDRRADLDKIAPPPARRRRGSRAPPRSRRRPASRRAPSRRFRCRTSIAS